MHTFSGGAEFSFSPRLFSRELNGVPNTEVNACVGSVMSANQLGLPRSLH